jgi:hypothetical protein
VFDDPRSHGEDEAQRILSVGLGAFRIATEELALLVSVNGSASMQEGHRCQMLMVYELYEC